MSRALNNLLKIAGAGIALYGVYKLGERRGAEAAMEEKQEEEPNPLTDGFNKEIQEISDYINELMNKPSKTKRDRDNIDLLEIKLRQLKNKL